MKLSDGAVYPAAPAGGNVASLPDDVAQAWREARTAHSVAAYSAAEMMCRKILMHMAVDRAGANPGRKFVEYLDDLKSGGYLTTGTEPAVQKIKDRGNAANHELPASTEQESLATLGVTQYLLRGLYEIPGLGVAQEHDGGDGAEGQ